MPSCTSKYVSDIAVIASVDDAQQAAVSGASAQSSLWSDRAGPAPRRRRVMPNYHRSDRRRSPHAESSRHWKDNNKSQLETKKTDDKR